MMQTSGFFNSNIVEGTPDRPYDASHFAEYFSAFIGDGVFAHNLNELNCVPSETNLSVTVQSGRAYMKGYWFNSSDNETMSFEANANANPRWDAIVVRFNMETRTAEIAVKLGAAYEDYENGRAYIYNNIARTSQLQELCLAIVRVPENSSTYMFTTADIYDVRAEEYCGWVTGLVDQIDTSSIVTQMQASFNAWFQQMKDQLSSDAAGNLQNQIDAIYPDEIQPLEEVMENMYGDIYTLKNQMKDVVSNTNYLMPNTLFENAAGGTGEISFGTHSVGDYDELEIYYCDNNYRTVNTTTVRDPENGIQIPLSLVGDENNYTTYIRRATYVISNYGSGMTLKPDSESLTTIARRATSPTGECETRITYGQQTFVRILKVIGKGDRLYKPVAYNETQGDAIFDTVEEVTE